MKNNYNREEEDYLGSDPGTLGILWDGNFSEIDFAEYTNRDDQHDFRTIIGISVMTAAILGIIANFFVLALSMQKVQGDFRHYVANLALVDIICGFLFAFMGFVNVEKNGRLFSMELLTFCALAFYGSFGVMVCALTPISLSRILAASCPAVYEKLFAGPKAMLICILSDLAPVSLLVVMCFANQQLARWLFFCYAIVTVAAYLIAFISNTMVFRIVARHIRVVQSLRDASRLLETRQIAIATLAQALVPLVCQVPAFLTLSSSLLHVEPVTTSEVIVLTQLWLAASPLFDALITIGVIKQYRKETIRLFTSSCKGAAKRKPTSTMIYSDEKEAFDTPV
ncbi:unnamed protein product, partial [Mesorhabditis spiculigera]